VLAVVDRGNSVSVLRRAVSGFTLTPPSHRDEWVTTLIVCAEPKVGRYAEKVTVAELADDVVTAYKVTSKTA
jgi:hypothetical protein